MQTFNSKSKLSRNEYITMCMWKQGLFWGQVPQIKDACQISFSFVRLNLNTINIGPSLFTKSCQKIAVLSGKKPFSRGLIPKPVNSKSYLISKSVMVYFSLVPKTWLKAFHETERLTDK